VMCTAGDLVTAVTAAVGLIGPNTFDSSSDTYC
jgi:hypothetical protein